MKTVCVEVFSSQEEELPNNAFTIVQFLKEKLDTIPDEYKAVARLGLDYEREYYDGVSPYMRIFYYRPVTDKEKADALICNQAEKDSRREWLKKQLAEMEKE